MDLHFRLVAGEANCGSLGFAPNEQNMLEERRGAPLAFSRRIPGLKRETWGTHRVSRRHRFGDLQNESDVPPFIGLMTSPTARSAARDDKKGRVAMRERADAKGQGGCQLSKDRVTVKDELGCQRQACSRGGGRLFF